MWVIGSTFPLAGVDPNRQSDHPTVLARLNPLYPCPYYYTTSTRVSEFCALKRCEREQSHTNTVARYGTHGGPPGRMTLVQ